MTDLSTLSGLLIADFSHVLAGPFATMTLGDLGAEVIKVERPEGDDTRAWGPPFVGDDSTYYLGVNRNKRSVVLDLTNPDDLRTARTLTEHADVVVENFRPGVMARFGLDEPTLRSAHPELIYCSISGFGTGAGRERAGYDLLVQALGGLMSITGPDDNSPTKVGVPVVDVLTGLCATVGILAALHERDKSGVGQHVEVNLLSTLLSALANQSSAYVLTGTVPHAIGNTHPSVAPYDTYATGAGTLVLAVGTDRQFTRLCALIGTPELSHDERFATNQARVRHRHALREHLERALAVAPASQWASALSGKGIPAGIVNTIAEAFTLATDLGLAPIRRTDDAADTLGLQVANPITLSVTPVTYRTRAPRLGEHGSDIRAWLDATEHQQSTA